MLILVPHHAESIAFCESLSKEIQKPLKKTSSYKEALEIFIKDPDSYFFFDVFHLEAFQEFMKHFGMVIGPNPGQLNQNRLFYIGISLNEEVKKTIHSDWFGHFIQIKPSHVTSNCNTLAKIIQSTQSENSNLLSTILESNAVVHTQHYANASSKTTILDDVQKFLSQEIGLSHRVLAAIMNATDELVMNAIYDAPLRAGDIPSVSFEFLNRTPIDVHMGHDSNTVAVTVVDSCGSISRTALYSHVLQALSDTKFETLQNSSGTGIGLATTFRCGGSLFYYCNPGKKTQATVLFKKTHSYKEFQLQNRFISTFIQEEDHSFLPKNTARKAAPIGLENK